MLYVGIAGLVVNLIGLLLFHQHSHGHGHGHSHGGGGGSKHSHGGNHTHDNDQNVKGNYWASYRGRRDTVFIFVGDFWVLLFLYLYVFIKMLILFFGKDTSRENGKRHANEDKKHENCDITCSNFFSD